MSRVCQLCGRRPQIGNQVTRRGIAKKKGGIGRRVTGRSKRRFLPNLQYVRAMQGGRVVRMRICTHCLKAGKIVKPGPRQSMKEAPKKMLPATGSGATGSPATGSGASKSAATAAPAATKTAAKAPAKAAPKKTAPKKPPAK